MAFNEHVVAEIVRQRLGFTDQSKKARILWAIPQALDALSRAVATNPKKRPLLITALSSALFALTSGAVDLEASALLAANKPAIMLEYLRYGRIWYLPSVTAKTYRQGRGGHASGIWTFNTNPAPGESITVNGVTLTFGTAQVIVSGAGTAAANGTYTFIGYMNNRPLYSNGTYQFGWSLDPAFDLAWQIAIYISPGVYHPAYYAYWNSYYPWDVSGAWAVNPVFGAVGPSPAVAEGSLDSGDIDIGSNARETADNFITFLNTSTNPLISCSTYATYVPPEHSVSRRFRYVQGVFDSAGTDGNNFTMAASSDNSVTVSGATFTGGTPTPYGLFIQDLAYAFHNLSKVRFTTSGSFPTGLAGATDYYIINYDGVPNTRDTEGTAFDLSSTPDGLTSVGLTSPGTGVLTMQAQEPLGHPLQWIASTDLEFSDQVLGDSYRYCWLDNYTLKTKALVGEQTLSGNLAFQVPYTPKMADFAASGSGHKLSELHEDLIKKVLEIVTGPGVED